MTEWGPSTSSARPVRCVLTHTQMHTHTPFPSNQSHVRGPAAVSLRHTHPFSPQTKAMCEDLLRSYPNVLTLRVRMPVDEDLTCPRNFVTKITKYPKASDD